MVILRTVAQGLRKNISAFQAYGIRSGLKSLQKYYRIDRSQIAFLKFIIEAYDGIAVLTTVDPGLGIVVLKIAPKCETIVAAVLEDLKKDILIEQILEPS